MGIELNERKRLTKILRGVASSIENLVDCMEKEESTEEEFEEAMKNYLWNAAKLSQL